MNRGSSWLGIGVTAMAACAALAALVPAEREEGGVLRGRTLQSGALLAARTKGGDPDGGSVRAIPGESRGDGSWALGAEEERAARKAYPAEAISPGQTAAAQRSFNQIKIRGNHGSKKGAFLWNSIGPTVAFQPGVLGFTGRDQVTAGRTTALLVDRTCNQGRCRVWIGAAGGGVWRTDHGLHTNNPGWKFSSGGLGSNAFGSLVQDPTDPSGDTLYAGTGEPNASGDSEAGVGLYKSRDGGKSWALIPASTAIANTRAIAKIAVDPTDGRIIYLAVARAIRGITSTSGGAISRTGTPQPTLGVYKTTDGGAIWTLFWNADPADAGRGVTDVEIDALDHTTVYASAFQQGIF